MAVEDVVSVLADYLEMGEDGFEREHGSEAVIAARDLADLLGDRFEEELRYEALWEDFKADPRAMTPDLIGALEAFIEADPRLAQWLEEFLEAYHSAIRPLEPAAPGEEERRALFEQPPSEAIEVSEEKARPIDFREDAGPGTYLYGNVRVGEASIEAIGKEIANLEEMERPEAPRGLGLEVAELFEQLDATVEARSDLGPDEKDRLRDELRKLEAQIALGDDADEERIVQHLRDIQRLDPAFLELVLTGIANSTPETRSVVWGAISREGE